MSDQPPNQYAAEPLTQLPLNGSYGGKPKRISIEFDDYSSRHIGNADGSVDIIFANLAKYYAETLQSDDQNFTITESTLNNTGSTDDKIEPMAAAVLGPAPANPASQAKLCKQCGAPSGAHFQGCSGYSAQPDNSIAARIKWSEEQSRSSEYSVQREGYCQHCGEKGGYFADPSKQYEHEAGCNKPSEYSGESSTGSVTIGPGPTTICQKCMLRMESCQCGNQREYSATLFNPNRHCDAKRVIVWIDNPERKAANTAFTEGLERQIAYRFESASDRATVRPGEISVVDDSSLKGVIAEAMGGDWYPGKGTGILNAIRPYLRTAQPAPATESSDDFDQIKARNGLNPEEREILKRPLVQSLLYDLNLLPEQITEGKHWFYMLSVIAHMDQAGKPKPVSGERQSRAAMAFLNAVRAEYGEKPITAQSGFSVHEWNYGLRGAKAVLDAAGVPYVK